jgi:hypothetical protein
MKVFLSIPVKSIIRKTKYVMCNAYISGFIIIAQIAVSCDKNSAVVNNELKEWRLLGAVKTVSEIDYSNTGKYTTYLRFNPNGLIQEQSSFNPDGSLIRKWKYEYNGRNQKLARYCYVLNDSLSGILHYSYNENDKIVEEKLLNPQGGLISKTEYEYDVNQNEIERRFIDENTKIQGRILYKYDDKKNVIEELHFDSAIHQNWKQKNIYNPEGLNVEILYLSLNDSLLKKSTYTYLSGKQVGEACFYDGKSELISKTTYLYDKQLNTTYKLLFYLLDKKTEKHLFVYKYDRHKNWTSRMEYINNEIDDIITRKLEYYK